MKTSLRSLTIVLLLTFVLAPAFLFAADKPEIMPLKDVKPGMKGYARTIFAGEVIETMELEVIGILPSLLGPKADIILVRLKGAKPDFTGVAAGMSGSPVYIDGKLVGALSLKFGIFTREAIGGVTPIENMIEVNVPDNRILKAQNSSESGNPDAAIAVNSLPSQVHYPVSGDFVQKLGVGNSAFLSPIETPLVFSGFQQAALARYADQFAGLGVTATSGGTVPPQPDDNRIEPGSMVGMVLMQGDLSLVAGCTVTAIIDGKVYVCGHPFFGHGEVEMPMSRGHMVTTLASTFASTKIMNSGGVIGTFTQDRLTAVMGHLGEGPKLIPVELIVVGEGGEKKFTFEVFEHPKFTPLLVGIAAFNGLISSTAYSEGMTFKLTGGIELKGHTSVSLDNMFTPTDQLIPDGFSVGVAVQSIFTRVYTNPYERVKVDRIRLRVEQIRDRQWATIENAWSEKSEAAPGETLKIKFLLRPYRGAPYLREVPITIPPHANRGLLRVLVSDSETLNRMTRFFTFAPQGRLPGLEQLLTLLNRERRNNQVYVTLLQPTPTLLLEDKEFPNAPLSQIQVLDSRRTPGTSILLRESVAGEWSLPLTQVVSGQFSITITVR